MGAFHAVATGWWMRNSRFVIGNKINTTWMERVAFENTFTSQPHSPAGTMQSQRLQSIFRATGIEPAARTKKRTESNLIDADEELQKLDDHQDTEPAFRQSCSNNPVRFSAILCLSSLATPGLVSTRISNLRGNACRNWLVRKFSRT